MQTAIARENKLMLNVLHTVQILEVLRQVGHWISHKTLCNGIQSLPTSNNFFVSTLQALYTNEFPLLPYLIDQLFFLQETYLRSRL